jgi:hypothetical protein
MGPAPIIMIELMSVLFGIKVSFIDGAQTVLPYREGGPRCKRHSGIHG